MYSTCVSAAREPDEKICVAVTKDSIKPGHSKAIKGSAQCEGDKEKSKHSISIVSQSKMKWQNISSGILRFCGSKHVTFIPQENKTKSLPLILKINESTKVQTLGMCTLLIFH